MHRHRLAGLSALLLFGLCLDSQAHVGPQRSVHDTVAGVADRLRESLPAEELRTLSREQLEQFLSSEEREALGTAHITFEVNQPVRVSILRDAGPGGELFWLRDRGFQPEGAVREISELRLELWWKDFAAGEVGLGVNSLSGGAEHYLVLVKPRGQGAPLVIDHLYPGQLRVADFVPGVAPYADRSETIAEIPASLRGQTLIRTLRDRRNDGRLLGLFRSTSHPSSEHPDHRVLTWSGDPQTTQAIQWRTGPSVQRGVVAYQERRLVNRPRPRNLLRVKARTELLEDPFLVEDSRVYHHTAELEGLKPGTTYVYCVGDGSREGWSEFGEFTTAPDKVVPFSFIYMGDAQNGLDRWGTLVHNAFRARPDAAFYLMAGDLVNRGAERDDWDSFFANAAGIFDRRQLVPVIGNHECQGGHPTLYLQQFALPEKGPEGVEPERAYAFEYSNALFVILDSNLEPETQAGWLEATLANSKATWKFVAYHHPAYSSAPNRDNRTLREVWTPLFDQYHVDLALQGHDHAYLRTYPLRGEQRVENAKDGTTYIVSVSGTKMYGQAERDTTAFGMTQVATYQVLDIQISGDRLVYRAYDIDGALRDEFVIEK